MIKIEGLSKSYAGLKALDGIDLEFASAKTTVLIGSSGCGKSTLLRSILGLIWPNEGQISINGERVSPENVARIRRQVGYVIQEGGLFPHLSAYDNVTLMSRVLRHERFKTGERIRELCELVRLPLDLLARFPLELSGGQRQRVGLIRALVLDPQVLLLDEPLAALDPLVRRELQQDLREIFRRLSKTVILVTHDLGEAAYLGDEIVLMRSGQVVQRGSLEDLVQRPHDSFVKDFVNAQRSPLERFHTT